MEMGLGEGRIAENGDGDGDGGLGEEYTGFSFGGEF